MGTDRSIDRGIGIRVWSTDRSTDRGIGARRRSLGCCGTKRHYDSSLDFIQYHTKTKNMSSVVVYVFSAIQYYC